MKRFVFVLLSFLAVGADAIELNRIVLRVNNQIATLAEYEQRRNDRLAMLEQQELSPERRAQLLANLGESVMQEIYEELLLTSRAEQLGIFVSDDDVNASIQQTRESFGLSDMAEFETVLAQSGMTLAKLENQMRTNLSMREVIGQEVRSQVSVEDEDVRRFYRANLELFEVGARIRVEEIVVLETSGLAAEELARTAAELARQARDGRTLTELAEIHADSGLTTELIEVGWVNRGDLGDELEAVVWPLEAGAVSEPVAARGGFHICQVVEREDATVLPFADVEDDVRARLGQEFLQEEMESYLADLGDSAHIVQHLPNDALGFEPRTATREEAADFFDALPSAVLAPEPADVPASVPEDATETEDGS